MVTDNEQEAFYRFLRNEKVTLEALLKPHAEATARRAASYPTVVVAHDTTEIAFKGDGRSRLYKLRSGTYGFGIHLSLAIGFGEVPCPLGVSSGRRGHHLHIVIRARRREELHSFLRVMAGQIAQRVTGAHGRRRSMGHSHPRDRGRESVL